MSQLDFNMLLVWQGELHRNCSNVVAPATLNITDNDTWCDWAPFGESVTFCQPYYGHEYELQS